MDPQTKLYLTIGFILLAIGLWYLAKGVIGICRQEYQAQHNARFWAHLKPYLDHENNPEEPLTTAQLDALRAARWD